MGISKSKGTTAVGYINKNGVEILRATEQPGTDHGQRVYVLRCSKGHEFGANGSDIWLRKCPECQGGAPGLSY